MNSGHHRVIMNEGGRDFETLEDILPNGNFQRAKKLVMLIIAKRPAPISVRKGHYFQGRQGSAFWNKLREYGIIQIPKDEFEDGALLSHGYGIMDIVKVPGEFGDEPTDNEYREGMERIQRAIKTYEPVILLFVYRRPLEHLLKAVFNDCPDLRYGFNRRLKHRFGAEVFLFPMPGAGRSVTKAVIGRAMMELKKKIH